MSNLEKQRQKVGVGIKTISVINLAIYCVMFLFSLFGLLFKDQLNSELVKQGVKKTYYSSNFVPIIIVSTLIVISVILILLKNISGVILYFIVCFFNILYSIIQSGVGVNTLTGLILPLIMGVFVYRKRDIFKRKRQQ
ncbi:hypothetical protein [Clostridium akagii]|uniref:hypothetical protein n=1 Tax=Clostridium akagii TaxID=91623 RepID=UPI00047B052B|nr:hypothetical protein [Clostridium akagii]